MSNPYGITLDSEWIEWATKEKASETVAAAVLLICETRPPNEVVAKLTPKEFERVVDWRKGARMPVSIPSWGFVLGLSESEGLEAQWASVLLSDLVRS